MEEVLFGKDAHPRVSTTSRRVDTLFWRLVDQRGALGFASAFPFAVAIVCATKNEFTSFFTGIAAGIMLYREPGICLEVRSHNWRLILEVEKSIQGTIVQLYS